MSLIELIAGVEAQEATLTVVNGDGEARDALADRFATRNVTVVEDDLSTRSGGFAVLTRAGEFVTAVELEALLEPDDRTDPEFAPETYRPILDELDETLFTSYSVADMVAASREIEDRAWRLGTGEVHAGFQTFENMAEQSELYNRLGEAGDLDVHAYGAPEGPVPDAEHFSVHVERAAEIRETWFVVYDGGGVDVNKCMLLAEEREPGRFYGFWSYDPETVDAAVEHLYSTYAIVESGEEGDATA